MTKAQQNDSAIPWQQWQRHDEAAEAYFRTKATGQGGNGNRGSRDTNIIRVKNNSGANRSAGHILEFTGLELSNLDGDIPMLWMTGGSPSLANAFGVLVQPLPDGESVPCQISGACKAKVNVLDAEDKYARVTSATYVLQSCALGPVRILYKPSGTGEKNCGILIPQAPDQSFICKPNAAYSMGENNATLNLYDKYSGSSLSVSLTGGIILTRDVLTTDWMSGTIINGVPHAAPIDCE